VRSLAAHLQDVCSDATLLQAGVLHVSEVRMRPAPLALGDLLLLPHAHVPHDATPGSAVLVHPRLQPHVAAALTSTTSLPHVEIIRIVVGDVAMLFVYRAPNTPLQLALHDVAAAVAAVAAITRNVLLMGDVNVDLLRADAPASAWRGLMTSLQLRQGLSDRPTHDGRGMLDHIWCSSDLANRSCTCGVLDFVWTDHKAVVCDIVVPANVGHHM
jgi:hypothetical protein